jgi:hypothetical protein
MGFIIVKSNDVPVAYTVNTSHTFTFAIPDLSSFPDAYGRTASVTGFSIDLGGTEPDAPTRYYGISTLISPSGAQAVNGAKPGTGFGWNVSYEAGPYGPIYDVVIGSGGSPAMWAEVQAAQGSTIALTLIIGSDFVTGNNFDKPYRATMTRADLSISYGYVNPPSDPSAPSLAFDAPGRPCAVLTSNIGLISQNAGHTFIQSQIATGTNASLLIDTRQNRFRVVYAFRPVAPATTPPAGLYSAAGYLTDAFPLDAGSPAIIGNLSGTFPVAATHPTDRDYALLAYADGGALKSAWSMDAGASWNPSSTIAPGVNFAASGRPALAFLGDTAAVVYAAGSSLLVQTSQD